MNNQGVLILIIAGAIFCEGAVKLGKGGMLTVTIDNFRPSLKDQYICSVLDLSDFGGDNQTLYLTQFQPQDENLAAHHMVLIGCSRPGITGVQQFDCGSDYPVHPGMKRGNPCASDEEVTLFGVAFNAGGYQLPPDLSFRVGAGTSIQYIVLEVHYGDMAKFEDDPGLVVNVGFNIFYTTQRTKHVGGNYLLSGDGFIPPNNPYTGVSTIDMVCKPNKKRREKMTVFSYSVHTHYHGEFVVGYRIRKESAWTLIGRKSPHLEQTYYSLDQPMTIEPEDTIAGRCVFNNTAGKDLPMGNTVKDEMCNFMMIYYTPSGELLEGCYVKRGQEDWRQQLHPIPVPDTIQQQNLLMTAEEKQLYDNRRPM